MSVRVIHGDALEAMRALAAEGVTVDAVVTDPPYHLTSIVQRFGKPGSAPAKSNGATGVYARASAGFMGKQWDGGDIAFDPETWAVALALLPPGGHLLAFGGTRTYHRLACAIEDAGFEIRDQIGWLYGSGFPKSHDFAGYRDEHDRRVVRPEFVGHPQAEGWGTALKPAWEPIVVARKPLAGTVAENVLEHGTGALHVDACRVPTDGPVQKAAGRPGFGADRDDGYALGTGREYDTTGRWPANVVHDGSDEVMEAFAAFGERPSRPWDGARNTPKTQGIYGAFAGGPERGKAGDTGTAVRFFYAAKASKAERAGSKHPTVKPLALMRWLVRLVTPPGGTVLDPFAGTGPTGEAADLEGFDAILIEREAEYVADIHARLRGS